MVSVLESACVIRQNPILKDSLLPIIRNIAELLFLGEATNNLSWINKWEALEECLLFLFSSRSNFLGEAFDFGSFFFSDYFTWKPIWRKAYGREGRSFLIEQPRTREVNYRY